MNIEPNRKYEYTVDSISFGCIPPGELVKELSSGRLCGVLLETDIGHRFENLTKDGCGQGSGEDLRVSTSDGVKTVQAKTVRLNNSVKGRKNAKYIDQDAAIGWTTKSGLWDSGRGTKRSADEWDQEHEQYMEKYDFFLYINIDDFPKVSFIMVPSERLSKRSEAKHQAHAYHYGKTGKRTPTCPPPEWKYPISITRGMWDDFAGSTVTEVEIGR